LYHFYHFDLNNKNVCFAFVSPLFSFCVQKSDGIKRLNFITRGDG